MKTLHNTKNCNYRRFLYKKLKHGKISGKFYKFICRSHPYRITTRNISLVVREVLDGKMTENRAIRYLQKDTTELKYQQELYKSNIECRKKIGWEQINERKK
jgi:hypothetical protein